MLQSAESEDENTTQRVGATRPQFEPKPRVQTPE
jgi:hypothetical protein